MIPFDTEAAAITSGIRIGTPAITSRGFNEADCVQVVHWIDAVLSDINNTEKHQTVKNEINNFMQKFPLYPEIA